MGGREERQGEGKGIKAIWDEEYSNHCRDVCCEGEMAMGAVRRSQWRR
jgi:hypothetical protein